MSTTTTTAAALPSIAMMHARLESLQGDPNTTSEDWAGYDRMFNLVAAANSPAPQQVSKLPEDTKSESPWMEGVSKEFRQAVLPLAGLWVYRNTMKSGDYEGIQKFFETLADAYGSEGSIPPSEVIAYSRYFYKLFTKNQKVYASRNPF